ncbi:acyl-ACP desaturase [Streptomyces sp. OfavH-34-F]|uniref:acyl-ACP desaturase n=1 Tax=Streptomyces sp. OfavH-34-F TaxID=2917760 RepID=UPI001EF2E343|nr:acyl-ACP desaturase [Streptomyces sp. OfavH-34-F]MCG7529156.1 acyl-ACP desaturase [Streptomyces sp. OfavH-34-F]
MNRPNRDDAALIAELEPVAARLLDRHVTAAREWFPHQYVPWSAGRDFDGPLDGDPWREEQSRLSPAARAALVVNLLTEDNLPGYYHALAVNSTRDGAWGEWLNRWTAEEDRHASSIRGYLHTTRAVDPVALERARMAQLSTGFASPATGCLSGIAYVALQELATRISHRNTGRFSGDPVCERLMARIAQDENLHMVFYREVLRAALTLTPDEVVVALEENVRSFRMPGHAMPGFAPMAAQIAVAGVYDPRIHHDDVLVPLLRSLGIFDVEGLGARGEQAREALAGHLQRLDVRAARFTERRAQALAARQRRGDEERTPAPDAPVSG